MIEIKQISTEKNVYRLEATDTDTGNVVGFAELKSVDKPVPVFFCKVEESYMGRKIGTEMLKKTVAYAKSAEKEGIFVRYDGNVRAKMMLKKQGFHLYTKEIAMLEL